MRSSFDVKIINGLLWGLFVLALGLSGKALVLGGYHLSIVSGEVAGLQLSLGMMFDTLSSVLLLMVTLLGAVIGQYSLRYLDGESRQRYFYHALLLTVSSVALLITSSNLIMFFLMWLTTSYGLHKLLLYYGERPRAAEAARKKFLISRLGDLSLLAAIALTYQYFQSFEFAQIFASANELSADAAGAGQLSLIGFLFALGAMTKSAQFPFHFWLPETMETPTPVSALMHAGIINAGGFLMIRLSPLLQHAPAAHLLLILMGSVTAVFGALVMITQSDIKRKLAYSTISQMGMMMFACGLGAYSIALFHMIAHSFYKAHAFLSTGYIVEESKKIGFKVSPLSVSQLALWSALGLIVMAVGFVVDGGSHLGYFAYAAVQVLGLGQNLSFKTPAIESDSAYSPFRVVVQICGVLATAVVIFAGAEIILNQSLSAFVPTIWDASVWSARHAVTVAVAYAIFITGFWLSSKLMSAGAGGMLRLYVYLWNGGYFSQRSSRALQRLFAAG